MASAYPPSSAPRFTVTVGGTEFPEYDYVSEVVVDTTMDGANHALVTFTHPYDHEHRAFSGLDWRTLRPGTEMTVELGYGEGDSATEQVFTGAVDTLRPEFGADLPPKVVVSAFGPLRKMMRGTNSRSWQNRTLAAVVESVVSKYFASVEIRGAKTRLDRVFQDRESDYRFVERLAEKYGYEFFASLGTVYFRPDTGDTPAGDPVATLTYGESVESCSAQLTPPAHGTVEVRHYDETKNRLVVGTAKNESGSGTVTYTIPVESKSQATAVAEAKLQQQEVSADVTMFGNPSVLPGTVVKLDGLIELLSGEKFGVRAARHRVGDRAYRMNANLQRPHTWTR